ncbi:MAG: energy-coupling factor ABC transporter permease, partial [Deltaproteobacteria bacterium]|nr:energy-coupling factor ABC transporter permease [Deltaproteobacteria bacterium]
MHIPDGYLSPKTCVLFYAAMAPVWYLASKKVETAVGAARLPLLALGAAFTFVIMMFNIPVPGGSTGHMTGGVIVAVVLGPWAGVVAMTLTVALQAFLFGDGGVTAIGANAFNMAFVMPFAGYYS